MSQRRIQDYGSTVVASSLKQLSHAIVSAAVLKGNEFVVDSPSKLRVNPGTCVTNQGTIIIEDEPKYLDVPNTSSPVDYTIYYAHSDADISGGVPAELIIDSGLLTPDVVSGVILGYVRYTGFGVPLSSSMFTQVYPAVIGQPIPTRYDADFVVPINNQYLVTQTIGGALDITNTWDEGPPPNMYLKIRNNGVATGAVMLTFPFKVKSRPYGILQILASSDVNATLTPMFIDSDGITHSLSVSNSPVSTNFSLITHVISPTAVQDNNSVVYVQMLIQCAATREFRLQALGLNEYNLPV